MASSKPFDGAISNFLNDAAPAEIRKAIENAKKNRPVDEAYPYKNAWIQMNTKPR